MFEGLFQPTHLIVILVIVLVIFGPGKLPEIGGALGKSIREFKHSTAEALEDEPKATTRAAAAPAAEASQTCAACQAANPPGNKFCAACGAKLG